MALIQCPECGGKVSDRASVCPSCGHPRRVDQTRRSNDPQKSAKLEDGQAISGYVYVFSNPSFGEDLYKIGKTTRSAHKRAKELSTQTGVPEGFKIEFARWVRDCHEAEVMIHGALNKYRGNKEFFQLPLEKAVRIVQAICSYFDEDEDIDPNTDDHDAEFPEVNSDEVTEPTKPEVPKPIEPTEPEHRVDVRCPRCGKAHTVTLRSFETRATCPRCWVETIWPSFDEFDEDYSLYGASGKKDSTKGNQALNPRMESVRRIDVRCKNCEKAYTVTLCRDETSSTCPHCFKHDYLTVEW
jgi:hypothetical protein